MAWNNTHKPLNNLAWILFKCFANMTKLDKVSNATNCKSKSTLRIYPTETETETDTETATKSGRANDQQKVVKSAETERESGNEREHRALKESRHDKAQWVIEALLW